MAAMLNVNRQVTDIFYRYKMPKLIAKVEGKGNGIKTVIVNMVDVAKALGRPPTYPTKYFGCELGAQTQFDFKDERFIVNGAHDSIKLQDLLDGFIKKFVLCPECENPETTLTTRKSALGQSCKACGWQGVIAGGHRLITFIIKNPPTVNPSALGASLTESKRIKRLKKPDNDNSQDKSDDGLDNNTTTTTTTTADEDDDDDWSVDVSEQAVRARQLEDLTQGASALTLSVDVELNEKDRVDLFYGFVGGLLEKVGGGGGKGGAGGGGAGAGGAGAGGGGAVGTAGGKLDEKVIVAEAERLEIKAKAVLVLVELLLAGSGSGGILQEIKRYRTLFLRFTHENPRAQRYLIGGLEQMINLNGELLAKVALILKQLYDLDILDEQTIHDWYSHGPSRKYVGKELSGEILKKAQPFVTWLKEADEEEEEEESGDGSASGEEDGDVEIEYSDRIQATGLKAVNTNEMKQAATATAEDDLDIDAI